MIKHPVISRVSRSNEQVFQGGYSSTFVKACIRRDIGAFMRYIVDAMSETPGRYKIKQIQNAADGNRGGGGDAVIENVS